MKRYGLIGKSLGHSFSKNYFTKKFTELNINDCSYENFELQSIDHLKNLLKNNPDINGLNVTIPYKEDVLSLLDEKDEIVREIGACNCIKIREGLLSGFNTDAVGFKKTLLPKLKPHHKKALVLGTGGAAKAVAYVLDKAGIEYFFVSRRQQENHLGYEDLGDQILESHHLIINTTPVGMYPNVHDDPPIPYEYITPQHFLFDLIYNPAKTKFLLEGEKRSAQIENGYEMLVFQAEESWRIWNESI